MDGRRFDSLARSVAGHRSRRTLVRGFLGGAALVVTRLQGLGVTAHHGYSGPGDPCRHDDQCRAADTSLVCAWNGYGHDGDWNCCTFDGGRCADDGGCCGYGYCAGGFCAGGSAVISAGSGGVANASADGGTISIGNINSGGNAGNAISVGNTQGNVAVDGGYVSNNTDISASADGGVAIADASGGSGNVAGNGGYYQSGWYGPGDVCPRWCAWGYGCGDCSTGYCNWNGYCDWD